MKYQINLLQEKEKDLSGKVVYFALHYLRYILVLTQIVVIAVFFYRFKIDQEVIDLRDELQQKQEIVQVSDPLLAEAKSVDIKTREVKTILISQDSFQQMLDYFLSVFPSNMKTDHIEVSKDEIIFEGVTNDPQTIKGFLDRLHSDKYFKKINLGSIRRDESGFHAPFSLTGFIPQQ